MNRFNIAREPINGLKVISPTPIFDDRGLFQRLLCINEFSEFGFNEPIVNINHSTTKNKGTIRGLHFQHEPSAEIKIIKCIKGSIYDVVIDIRKNSSTFLQSFTIELNTTNNFMLLIPKGFAHGFQSLENDSEIIYFVTNYYSKEFEDSLNPFDPELKIEWPLKCTNISKKDNDAKFINKEFSGVEI